MNDRAAWPRRCAITGAGGFIGSRLITRWAELGLAGHRALVRRPESAQALRAQGCDVVQADLLQPASLEAALAGCDAVVHLAHGDRGPEAMRNLLAAMAKAGVRRLVHVSTMSVHGPDPGPEAEHEATATIGRYGNDYCDSKAEQEELAWAAHRSGALRCVVLRPTVVYGPGSAFVTQVVEQARQGEVSWFDEGRGLCNAVYVDDVCAAIEAALQHPEAEGEAFFVNADQAVPWRRFIEAFAAGVEPAPRFVNLSSAEAIAYWAQRPAVAPPSGLAARVWRKLARAFAPAPAPAPFPPLGRVQRETIRITFSNAKARAALGWAPAVDFDEGVRRTRAWLRDGGPRA